MKGHPDVIKFLNTALGNELVAINQYFLHARTLQEFGLNTLGDTIYKESIDEMIHADWLIKRILRLSGPPNVQSLGRIHIGKTTEEILKFDIQQEQEAVPILKEGITCCEKHSDFVSRELLEKILAAEDEHIEWLETQLTLIDKIGIQNYQQTMI